MRILLIEPHKPPYPLEIDETLAAMKNLVGGTIQAVIHSRMILPSFATMRASCLVCH